ncbi:MAG: tRNA preQ1(34) S-adenosylmethionine ribosyltransferase-isomerase QueA [Deltaproteobacteria bacterium]|nr:tRNA preQ1(34) S-adenosylmethionine ribosyltransferase-isomerase QueA [Deltaproteobacteria bacterium]
MSTWLSDYDYVFPSELIADKPLSARSASRMMLLQGENIEHAYFKNLSSYLKEGDLLIFNETKVLPARLKALRESGGRVEIFLLRDLGMGEWEVLLSPAKRLKMNESLELYSRFKKDLPPIKVKVSSLETNNFKIKFESLKDQVLALSHFGEMPLPPYIVRNQPREEDQERYQTLFAKNLGAVAAPTASLHFDESILSDLKDKKIEEARLTLHVGAGTFAPVKSENIQDHLMHEEYYEIPEATLAAIEACQKRKGRLIAVGTTSLRALEAYAKTGKRQDWTDIFISPGYQFKLVKNLLTNFHQPKSTLLMLVSALVGRENILAAYQEAIKKKYRLFSYGDCMLILD